MKGGLNPDLQAKTLASSIHLLLGKPTARPLCQPLRNRLDPPLRQALALALARNPELAMFSWDVRIGEARMLQARLHPNPEVDVGVENILERGISGAAVKRRRRWN